MPAVLLTLMTPMLGEPEVSNGQVRTYRHVVWDLQVVGVHLSSVPTLRYCV